MQYNVRALMLFGDWQLSSVSLMEYSQTMHITECLSVCLIPISSESISIASDGQNKMKYRCNNIVSIFIIKFSYGQSLFFKKLLFFAITTTNSILRVLFLTIKVYILRIQVNFLTYRCTNYNV